VQTTAAGSGGGTITSVTAGAGLTGGGTSGAVTLTNTDTGSSQNIFKNVANAAGTTQFAAGSNNDSLRFEGTGGTSVTFDNATKKVIINSSTSSTTSSAPNVSTGQFGQNVGGGDFSFPANVGIGTTSPAAKLHIVSGTDNPNTFLSLDTGVHGGSQFQIGGTTNNESYFNLNVYRAGLYFTRLSVSNFGHLLLQPAGDNNVGIGTTTPTAKLHVVGDGKVTGNLTVDGNIAAKYQDVAEWVPASEQISAGTVVVLDSTKSNHVMASKQVYDTRVAGVISAEPGIALGERGDHKVLVATTGRVRIKVDATRGPIHIGDLLVTSDISGMAMKSEPVNIGGVQIHRPGTLIGKALEPLAKGQGEILVLLSLQ
ncbi:MAG: hypothetical protein WAV20_24525, partial [Blastocatellia bacterium]